MFTELGPKSREFGPSLANVSQDRNRGALARFGLNSKHVSGVPGAGGGLLQGISI